MPKKKQRIKATEGQHHRVQFSDAEKKAVETEYGYSFPVWEWDIIQIITNRYLADAASERRGAPINDIRKKLEDVVRTAWELRTEFPNPSEERFGDGLKLDYRSIFKTYYEEGLPKFYDDRGEYILLSHTLDALIAISLAAGQKLDDRSGQADSEGTSWDLWVCFLEIQLEKFKMPTKVRKDSDKSSSVSAFVIFIKSLQQTIPPDYRRFTHSDVALSQAIYRARKRFS